MIEVVAAAIATVATSLAAPIAALAYYKAQGFPLLEAIRLARESRRWMRDEGIYDRFPYAAELDDLADRKLRGFKP